MNLKNSALVAEAYMRIFPSVPRITGNNSRKISGLIQQALAVAKIGATSDAAITKLNKMASASGGILQPFSNAEQRHPTHYRAARPEKNNLVGDPLTERRNEDPRQFLDLSYKNSAGTRSFKLYVPKGYHGAALPLVVMLHGCKQNPDDFAAGTRMNELAERYNFLVVYPAQSSNANGSNCWNWFRPQDQTRDGGEPSIIAGIIREIVAAYSIDEDRIFVAGMSAGAAMAVILGRVYPDLFAAVGAHSGLPYGAADTVPSAFSAMAGHIVQTGASPYRPPQPSDQPAFLTPTIVFHGDRDMTVNVVNGTRIVEQIMALAPSMDGVRQKTHETRKRSNGRDCTVLTYSSANMIPVIEHWVLHGAGHSWSGGSSKGSYTDAAGPDASVEMVRFFLGR